MPACIIEKLEEKEILDRGIRDWPVWTKEISRFPYTYDETEHCLFIEGEVIIETKEGKQQIFPGDFVTFENGLECVWDIRKPVKKYYQFE